MQRSHTHVIERARGGAGNREEAKLTTSRRQDTSLCVGWRLGHRVNIHDPKERVAERVTMPARVCSSRWR